MTALGYLQRSAHSVAALVLAAAAQCVSATSPAFLLPGLYRIDSESTSSNAGQISTVHGRSDGASGDHFTRVQMHKGLEYSQKHTGSGPITHCISRVGQWYLPSTGPEVCNKQVMNQVGDAIVITALCPAGQVKLTLRRLDETRWEQISEAVVGGTDVPPSVMGLKPLLQMAARAASTPEERAAASKHLSQLPALQQQMVEKRGEAIDQLTASMQKTTDAGERESIRKVIAAMRGTPQIRDRTRQVWTRIGSCTPAKKIK